MANDHSPIKELISIKIGKQLKAYVMFNAITISNSHYFCNSILMVITSNPSALKRLPAHHP